MPAGRPSEMTEEKLQKLEHAFSIDCSIDEACFYADIAVQTYYNWTEARPDLLERFNALRNKPVLTARTTVVNAIEKDPELALKYLERKKKSEFSPKQEIDNNLSGSINIGTVLQEIQGTNTNS